MGWLTQFYSTEDQRHNQPSTNKFTPGSLRGLLTQNTRGFRDDTRAEWMASWKMQVEGKNIDYILIQETHVGTEREAKNLQTQWARAWGQNHEDDKPLSFWSIAESNAIGVAILLRPGLPHHFTIHPTTSAAGRLLVVSSPTLTIANVYAPNAKPDREAFFTTLHQELAGLKGIWFMAGDFNCVLDPTVDRAGSRNRTRQPESPALHQLVATLHLSDAALTSTPRQAPQLTHFNPANDRGARLDRCYASQLGQEWVTSSQAIIPKVGSDHLGVITWLRDPAIKPRQRPMPPLLFPIRGRDQDAVDAEVGNELDRIFTAASKHQRPWDDTVRHIADALRKIKHTEKKRARRAQKNWERRLRKRITTRDELIEYEKGRLLRQMQRRHGSRLEPEHGAVFSRLKRRAPTVIASMNGDQAASVADRLAAAWTPLLSASHATCPRPELRDRLQRLVQIPTEHRLSGSDNAGLMAEITAAEVEETIKQLGAHKAGGADRLNNDFYKAWAPMVAEPLADEFNRILKGQPMPASFKQAVIVPLPKNGASSNAMDYRPISLLQSSYKILTKLIASRLQKSLGKVINADQNGFVRGRDMANNIFLMLALLNQNYTTEDDSAEASPVAVLLDFLKAYDTLDRAYLSEALLAFGFDQAFVDLVGRLHDGTIASFVVDGDVSAPIDVGTGIRQGCPLAPLLFLIAVETLKYAIAHTPGVRGVVLRGADHEFHHGFSAFVDDSVVFAEKGSMLAAVEQTLTEFAALSGLNVQPTKSHAIVLNARCAASTVGHFPVVAAGETVRYLGVEIGLGDTTEQNWTKRLAKLKKSLGRASQIATGLWDRVTVLNAVGLPAVLFTAKYFTPPPPVLAELDSIWRTYLWNGTITTSPLRAHKIARPVLALPREFLGLGLRDIREAMIDQAARTILQWNSRKRDKYWTAMHLLLANSMPRGQPIIDCYPSRHAATSASSLDGKHPLLSLGLQRVSAALVDRYQVPATLVQLKNDALLSMQEDQGSLQWLSSREGLFAMPRAHSATCTRTSAMVYAAQPHEIRSFWLGFVWWDNVWITDDHGQVLKASDFPGIGTIKLADLALKPTGDGTFRFRNPFTTDPFQLRESQRQRLLRWLKLMVINHGFHLADPTSWANTRVYSLNDHPTFNRYEWRVAASATHTLRLTGSPLSVKWRPTDPDTPPPCIVASVGHWGSAVQFVDWDGDATTQTDFETLSNGTEGLVILAGHPAIQHGPTLLPPAQRFRRPRVRTDLQRGLRGGGADHRQRTTAFDMLTKRLDAARARDDGLQAVLRTKSPRTIQNQAPGETIYQAIFRYRSVMGSLNLRSNTGEPLQCPHTWCPGHNADLSLTHVLWTCQAATRTWHLVHRQWARRPPVLDQSSRIRCSLGPEQPVLAREIRRELEREVPDRSTTTAAQRSMWHIIQAVVPHQLWLHRNAAAFQGQKESVHGIAAKIWATIITQASAFAAAARGSSARYDFGRALSEIITGISKDASIDQPSGKDVRLYYDGGARGNPGTSGAGSLLLERLPGEPGWTTVWWSAAYLGEKSTNNVAEHTALATGLVEAARRYGDANVKVTVVGDSMMATRQLKGQTETINHKFHQQVARSRAALLQLYDYEFQHTRRAGNKAADWLANLAMDRKATLLSSTSPIHDYHATMTALDSYIPTDATHEWTDTASTSDVARHIRLLIDEHARHLPTYPKKRQRPIALQMRRRRPRPPRPRPPGPATPAAG